MVSERLPSVFASKAQKHMHDNYKEKMERRLSWDLTVVIETKLKRGTKETNQIINFSSLVLKLALSLLMVWPF